MDTDQAARVDEAGWPNSVAHLLSLLAAGLIFALMALIFADVVARYVLQSPITGAFEIVGFILGNAIFAAIAVASYRNEHITVSIFDHLFRGRVRWYQQGFVLLFSAVATGFIAYRMFSSAEKMRETNLLTLMFDFQVAPVVYSMAALAAIACALIVALFINHLKNPTTEARTTSATLD